MCYNSIVTTCATDVLLRSYFTPAVWNRCNKITFVIWRDHTIRLRESYSSIVDNSDLLMGVANRLRVANMHRQYALLILVANTRC